MSGIHEMIEDVSREFIRTALRDVRRQNSNHIDQRIAAQEANARRREKQLETKLTQQNQRLSSYDSRISSLDKTLKKNRMAQQQEVRKLNQKFQNDLKDVNKRMELQHIDVLRRLKAQGEEMHKAIETQGDHFRSQLDQLHQEMRDRIGHQEGIAQTWIHALSQEIEFISDTYRHQLFSPGKLAVLKGRLEQAEEDLKQQMPQSALSLGREAYYDACRLHDDLECRESIWSRLYPVAVESVSNVLGDLKAHRSYSLCLDQASGKTVEMNMDYWTWGKRQELETEIQALSDQLTNLPDTLDNGAIEQMILRAGEVEDALTVLDQQAVTRLIGAIRRNDIQEQILEKLSGMGYSLVEATLQGEAGDDFRGAHYVKMQNSLGEEIVTIVDSEEDSDGFKNRLQFNFYDKTINDALRSERMQEITDYLNQEEGIHLPSPTCVPEYRNRNAPEEVRDFKRVRQPLSPSVKKNRYTL